MPAQAPFTAYIKVVPLRGRATTSTGGIVRRAGRFDYVRELQKLSAMVYELLSGTSLVLAHPGGGQNYLTGRFGTIVDGGGVTPQFGNKPSLIMIEGFYMAASANPEDQVAARRTLIHSGEVLSGYAGQYPWDSAGLPTDAVAEEVADLKAIIENAITSVGDATSAPLKVFRLIYKGITWGDRGHTFPN